MATEESISMEAMDIQGGKITFAPDVIATIASLAANEVGYRQPGRNGGRRHYRHAQQEEHD